MRKAEVGRVGGNCKKTGADRWAIARGANCGFVQVRSGAPANGTLRIGPNGLADAAFAEQMAVLALHGVAHYAHTDGALQVLEPLALHHATLQRRQVHDNAITFNKQVSCSDVGR